MASFAFCKIHHRITGGITEQLARQTIGLYSGVNDINEMAYSRSNLITRGIFHTTWSLEQPQSLLTGQVLKDYETVSQKL